MTPWDVSTAIYDEKFHDVASEDFTPYSVFFKPDGLKMYVMGNYNMTAYQYSLSVAWDVSTASYTGKFINVSGQDRNPTDIFLKPDGTKMYIMGNKGDDVEQYSLLTPWDISTASYDSKFFDTGDQEVNPYGVFFKSDGMKMYVIGWDMATVFQYSLSAAWDVSTASYDDKSHSVSNEDGLPASVFFKSDGLKMYVVGMVNDIIYQYSLSAAWDVSTASYDDKSFDPASQETSLISVFFKPDGIKMYILGTSNDSVFQYSLPPIIAAGARSHGYIF